MEVASPLPFGHSATGNKRQFSGSPGLVDSTNRSPFTMHMEASDEYVNPRFKRRRFTADDTMTDSDSATVQASFPSFPSSAIQQKSSFSGASGQTFKRCRTEALSPSHDLQRVVESQAEEIENLRSAKSDIENSFHGLKAEHEKTVNENRILKRAVTIQQERQNQAQSEIQAGRQYKVDAVEQIAKLEHIILSLRYHLQAQHTNPGNDFMGFPPRPPDVY